MNKLLSSMITLFISISLITVCSCKESTPEELHQIKLVNQTIANSQRFAIYKLEEINRGGRCKAYILVDKQTRVQYLYIIGGYHAGLTALIDSVGKPILYKGELPKVSY